MSWIGSSRFTMFNQAQVTLDLDVWEKVFQGVRESRILTISYQKPGKANTVDRVFQPYHVVCHKGGWYVIGYDFERSSICIYSLSRLKKVFIGKKTFTIPDTFKLTDYVDPEFGVFMNTAPETFVIRFNPPASHIIGERKWHASQQIVFNEDESCVLSFRQH